MCKMAQHTFSGPVCIVHIVHPSVGINLNNTTSVQQSHSCWKEAVPQSGGPAPDAPQPSPRRKRDKTCKCRMGGILYDAVGPLSTSGVIDVCGGGEAAPNNPLLNSCYKFTICSFHLLSCAQLIVF